MNVRELQEFARLLEIMGVRRKATTLFVIGTVGVRLIRDAAR